jgi:FkbM family methyltransferase
VNLLTPRAPVQLAPRYLSRRVQLWEFENLKSALSCRLKEYLVIGNRLRRVGYTFSRLPLSFACRLVILHGIKALLRMPLKFSYAQTGEDEILCFLLPQQRGYYVDIGANDPIKYSNTFQLYLRGWNGITVDANDELIRRHRRVRKNDISVCAAVSDGEHTVLFHRSVSDLVSTIDSATFDEWKTKWTFHPEQQMEVVTRTLTSILEETCRVDSIDLLCIDVEGHELQVLQGLDFEKYRPRVIVIEVHDLITISENPSYKLLISQGYTMIAYATMNAYFRA